MEWDRRSRDPMEDAARVHDSCVAFAVAFAALGRRVAAGDWIAPPDRTAWGGAVTAFLTWSAANPSDVQRAVGSLSREALIGVQNLARGAFMALLTRTLMEPPHRERFYQFADRMRTQFPGGSAVSAADAIADLHGKFEADGGRIHPVFASVEKFESYVRPRLRSQVRDAGRGEDAHNTLKKNLAEQHSDEDGETPSYHIRSIETAEERAGQEAAIAARLAALPARRRAYWVLAMKHGWDATMIAEAFHGDDVRPEAAPEDDDEERRRRGRNRNSKARAVSRDLEAIIQLLACGDDPPAPPGDGPGT